MTLPDGIVKSQKQVDLKERGAVRQVSAIAAPRWRATCLVGPG